MLKCLYSTFYSNLPSIFLSPNSSAAFFHILQSHCTLLFHYSRLEQAIKLTSYSHLLMLDSSCYRSIFSSSTNFLKIINKLLYDYIELGSLKSNEKFFTIVLIQMFYYVYVLNYFSFFFLVICFFFFSPSTALGLVNSFDKKINVSLLNCYNRLGIYSKIE